MIYVMQIGDTTRAQFWSRQTVVMEGPRSLDHLGYPNIEVVEI